MITLFRKGTEEVCTLAGEKESKGFYVPDISHTQKTTTREKKEETLQCVGIRFNNLILETFMSKNHFDPQDILQACVKKEETLLFTCRSPGDVI